MFNLGFAAALNLSLVSRTEVVISPLNIDQLRIYHREFSCQQNYLPKKIASSIIRKNALPFLASWAPMFCVSFLQTFSIAARQ